MSFFWSRIRCWIPKALVFSGLWHFPQSFLFFHDLDNFWRTNRASSRMSLRLGAWQFLAVREHGFLGHHHRGGDVLCASHPFPVTLTLSFLANVVPSRTLHSKTHSFALSHQQLLGGRHCKAMQKSCFSFNFRSRISASTRWPCLCTAVPRQWLAVSLLLSTCINENSPLRKRCPFSLLFIQSFTYIINKLHILYSLGYHATLVFILLLKLFLFWPLRALGEAGSQVPFWGALPVL